MHQFSLEFAGGGQGVGGADGEGALVEGKDTVSGRTLRCIYLRCIRDKTRNHRTGD